MRLAGPVLRQRKDRPANVAMNWIPEDGNRPKKKTTKDLAYDLHRSSERFRSNMEKYKEDRQ